MKITTILFDLDGTLLPMDQDEFTKAYFKLLSRKMAAYGYEPEALINGVWAGTLEMLKNNGQKTNEEAFWQKFTEIFGEKARNDQELFEEFYHHDFQQIKDCCGFNPKAAELVAKLKDKGYRMILATNPIFPAIATESRIRWAGLSPADFEMYTTYENTSYSKPNPEYFRFILEKMGLKAEECLMIGNDVADDLAALKIGIPVFILTDCLINKENLDISSYPHGDMDDLYHFIKADAKV
ncbi:HAD family hydrolase [Clostridiales bacterium COT073_COT-073]|nr:HAD family hydrolase [Clostridiales bacterium COT073_COT-073]